MPTQNRVGREQTADLCKLLPTEDLTFHCQATTLVIGQEYTLFTMMLLQHRDDGLQLFNPLLLLAIDPAGKNDQHQLPRL